MLVVRKLVKAAQHQLKAANVQHSKTKNSKIE